jgi:hypothetical protein
MLLRECRLDYEEKNNTAYITLTAPSGSYQIQILEILGNSGAVDLWIAPEELESIGIIGLDEDEEALIVRAFYRIFARLVFRGFFGTSTSLEFIVKELQPQKPENTLLETPANNQCRKFDNNTVHIWENLRFRSLTETRIAKELDRRKVLFFPNCMARLGFKEREKREPDFLVCHEGKWGILEVDGEDSHPHGRAAKDHERDRLFKQHGILLVEHFDASECWEDADGVVKEFLELLRKQR